MPDHPHVDATYNPLTLDDGTFAVEVLIPEAQPAKVSGFDAREKAEAWIERHRANVATGTIMKLRGAWARPKKPA